MNNAQLINQTSGDVEYYTQAHIIEAARRVMGRIDLDPASCTLANKTVQARTIYTAERDGLSLPWGLNVWLNHPFGRHANKLWIDKLVREYQIGNVKQACCICFASTSEAWFQPLFDYPQCYLSPRTNYIKPTGKLKRGVSRGSVVTYLGPNVDVFIREFSNMGRVMLPAKATSE